MPAELDTEGLVNLVLMLPAFALVCWWAVFVANWWFNRKKDRRP